jgi:MerR family transcriptional regulator, redox-sensitive transcriptional activator SoxR
MLTIGQVASQSGLKASAIRYYEARGLLPFARRKNGKRVFEESILERLAVIALAKTAGFQLGDIRGLLSGVGSGQPTPAWRAIADGRRLEIDKEIGRLTLMKHILARLEGCQCATLEECGRVFDRARSKLPPDPLEPAARRRAAAKRLRRRPARDGDL